MPKILGDFREPTLGLAPSRISAQRFDVLKRGALLIGLLACVACNVEVDDDDDHHDHDFSERPRPPRDRGPAAPVQKAPRGSLGEPPATSDAGQADAAPPAICPGSLPSGDVSCEFKAGGLCFASFEEACNCADCIDQKCLTITDRRGRLCTPAGCPASVVCDESDGGAPSDAATTDAEAQHGRLNTPQQPPGRLPRP